MKSNTLSLCFTLLCVIFFFGSCQKNDINQHNTDPNTSDSTKDNSKLNYSLLNNKFWISGTDPNEYEMGFRFYGDSSVTYSFMGNLYPTITYDSVYGFSRISKPDTLQVFVDGGSIGGFKMYSITDSTFTCAFLQGSDTILFTRIF